MTQENISDLMSNLNESDVVMMVIIKGDESSCVIIHKNKSVDPMEAIPAALERQLLLEATDHAHPPLLTEFVEGVIAKGDDEKCYCPKCQHKRKKELETANKN